MMRAFLLLLVSGLVVAAHHIRDPQVVRPGEEAILALGFILLASFLVGSYFPRLKLPRITGYLLAGIAFGPHLHELLNTHVVVLTRPSLDDLHLIDNIALGLIAFTAGGELKLTNLRRQWMTLASVTVIQSLFAFLGVAGVLFLVGSHLGGFEGYTPMRLGLASLLLACTAVATSPATTIAVINETGARGNLTELILGVTVVKDVVVIGVFAVVLAVARVLAIPGQPFELSFLGHISLLVALSVLAGVVLGALLGQFVERVGEELPVLLLAVAFLSVYLAEHVHLHGLLICMTAGFVVENFTPHGEDFIHAVERYSVPVYVVFFTLVGATMDLKQLCMVFWTAALLVGLRLISTFLGTWLAARLTGNDGHIRRYAWMGFIGQAGVTLGFALIIAHDFPLVGQRLATIIVAGVAINQVVGPPMLRYALAAAGEIPKAQETL